MAQIPLERLLAGVRPQEVRVLGNNVPSPGTPMPQPSATPPTDPNEAMRQLVMLLLRIPGIRELLLAELQKVQAGVGVANRLLDRPAPMLPPASGASSSSFLERLRQLQGSLSAPEE